MLKGKKRMAAFFLPLSMSDGWEAVRPDRLSDPFNHSGVPDIGSGAGRGAAAQRWQRNGRLQLLRTAIRRYKYYDEHVGGQQENHVLLDT